MPQIRTARLRSVIDPDVPARTVGARKQQPARVGSGDGPLAPFFIHQISPAKLDFWPRQHVAVQEAEEGGHDNLRPRPTRLAPVPP